MLPHCQRVSTCASERTTDRLTTMATTCDDDGHEQIQTVLLGALTSRGFALFGIGLSLVVGRLVWFELAQFGFKSNDFGLPIGGSHPFSTLKQILEERVVCSTLDLLL